MYTTVYACGDRSPIPSRCIFRVSDEKKSELHEKELKFKKKGFEDEFKISIQIQ